MAQNKKHTTMKRKLDIEIKNQSSSQKHFPTIKTIQTKNERANLVYAIKVKVANDGTYKIGMYGEVKFN